MTQRACLLAVATVFIGLWTPFYSGLIRKIKLPVQELELKMQGGDVITGFYGTIIYFTINIFYYHRYTIFIITDIFVHYLIITSIIIRLGV